MLLWSAGSLLAQTNPPDAPKLAVQQQEAILWDSYDRELKNSLAERKKKGDLDGYLIIENEQKRFEREHTVPFPGAAPPLLKAPAARYHQGRALLLRQYMDALDQLIKAEVKADRVEQAKRIKAEKDKAALELAALAAKVELPEAANPEKEKQARVVKALVGRWEVSKPKERYKQVWTFTADGKVLSNWGEGQWTLDEQQVRIQWNEQYWDTFALPLLRSVRGDSWTGRDRLRAVRLD